MDPVDAKIVGTGGAGALAAAASWVQVIGDVLQLIATLVAIIASCITIWVFVRSQKKGKVSATIQSEVQGPLGNVRSEAQVNSERSD